MKLLSVEFRDHELIPVEGQVRVRSRVHSIGTHSMASTQRLDIKEGKDAFILKELYVVLGQLIQFFIDTLKGSTEAGVR